MFPLSRAFHVGCQVNTSRSQNMFQETILHATIGDNRQQNSEKGWPVSPLPDDELPFAPPDSDLV